MYQYTLGAYQLENSTAEKDLSVLVDTKLEMSQQHIFIAKKASAILGCVRQSTGSRLREVILPVCSGPMKAQLECCVQSWDPQLKKDTDFLE